MCFAVLMMHGSPASWLEGMSTAPQRAMALQRAMTKTGKHEHEIAHDCDAHIPVNNASIFRALASLVINTFPSMRSTL